MPNPYDVWLAGEIDEPFCEERGNNMSAVKEWQIAIMEGLARPEATWVSFETEDEEELPF